MQDREDSRGPASDRNPKEFKMKITVFWHYDPNAYEKTHKRVPEGNQYYFPEVAGFLGEDNDMYVRHPKEVVKKVEEWLSNIKDDIEIITGSEIIILTIRCFAVEKRITDDVIFVVPNESDMEYEILSLNKFGELSNLPEGFCDTSSMLLDRLKNLVTELRETAYQ